MARSRNIKPGFFKNYELADAGPLAQLLFSGLWCLADKQGRLEDKPRLIKAEIFPYYDCDVNGELTVLARLGFICRYVVDGVAVIEVQNFKEHQNPHHTEKESKLPGNDSKQAANPHETVIPDINGALTVKQPSNNGECLADSRFLIPDSLTLIPDSKKGERAKALTRPDDVDAQVWSDWLQLRKAKKAPITETVLKTARKEAALADMPLVNFLEIWCARGSIGLEAAWLRNTDKSQASETVYQKSMRLRVAEISPALARPEPGRIGPDDFFANLAKQNRELANLTVLEIAP